MVRFWQPGRAILLLAALMITAAVGVKPAYAANTYTVNSTADTDDGACNLLNCTLREAINAAEAHSGKDNIRFNIAGAGPHTIVLTSALPVLAQTTVIDASNAELNTSCATGTLHIVLDGGGIFFNGLVLEGNENVVKGLVLQNSMLINLQFGQGSTITCNFLGTDVTGTAATGNFMGVYIFESSNNTIGGTNPGDRNLISGNEQPGIRIDNSNNNRIMGNLVGTDLAGTSALPNTHYGINISGGNGNVVGGTVVGARNVLSGNVGAGVTLDGDTTNNLVQGNYIGVDVTGTAAIGNGNQGIVLNAGGSGNVIGGTAAGAGNVISGNQYNGIYMGGEGTLIQGNHIGTNAAGDAAIPNTSSGIQLSGNSTGNTIGGSVAGAGNVISGNAERGIAFFAADSNIVQGNYIGTDATGTLDLGNGDSGVFVDQSDLNLIGGTVAGARNVISGNDQYGVTFHDGSASNIVQGNYIGTDATGMLDVGNGQPGINVSNSPGTVIGGAAGAGNVVAGSNSNNIQVFNPPEFTNTIVQGNIIGLSAHGGTPIPGSFAGIFSGNGAQVIATANVIGAHFRGMQVDSHPASIINADGAGGANCFIGNTIGYQNLNGTLTQNAENNWWGVSTGPNTTGGDTTSALVDADPHLTTRPSYCPPFEAEINGGMETDATPFDNLPDGWTFSKLAPTDILDNTVFHSGGLSMRVEGSGATKKLVYTLNQSGLKGDTVRFTVWTNTLDVPTSGAFKVTVKIFYQGSAKKFTVKLTPGTHDWEESLPIEFVAAKDFSKIEVTITYGKSSGTVWLDDAVLSVTP
jgi:CSLREA domain-containing protein